MTDSDESPTDQEVNVLVAMALPTFDAPGVVAEPTAAESAAIAVSMDLQQLGSQATWHEIRGSVAGVERGRVAELIGLAGAGGEQLGLAATASRDLGRWLAVETDINEGWGFATRAATERMVGYLHSASHHFGNVALRTLLLRPSTLGPFAQKAKRFAAERPDAPPLWKPYSTNAASYISLNRESARDLRKQARAFGSGVFLEVAAAVSTVTADDRWERMTGRRHLEYHRWRTQTAPGADGAEDPWVVDEASASMSLTVYAPGRTPFSPEATITDATDARAGLELLSTAMRRRFDIWHDRSDELMGA
jgi:hypothetical protein